MEKDKHTTNVSFYLATYAPMEADEQHTKEVLAVFFSKYEPYEINNDIFYTCYAHNGQHSICSQSFLAQKCKKITEKEQYQELFNELESIGYKLNVV
jgi:hypothetical protein